MNKFNHIINELAQEARNQDIGYAVASWCRIISQLGHYDTQKVKENANKWLNKIQLVDNPLNFLNKINIFANNESTNKVLILAFVATGAGLLQYLLNEKEKINKLEEQIIQDANYLSSKAYIKQKNILVLLIKSDRYQELIDSLKSDNYLNPEDSFKLYGATQGLWIGTENEFNKSQIKQELNIRPSVTTKSEYDVHFVKIELDRDDSRFAPNVNPMDRRDAFIELADKSPKIEVSPRLSCEAYEHTEFYSR